jgi:hypothetical protein
MISQIVEPEIKLVEEVDYQPCPLCPVDRRISLMKEPPKEDGP